MSGNKVISGSIFEFKLPLNLGFAYCKIIDFRDISEVDGILCKVFDFVSTSPIESLKPLNNKDWLFGARCLYKMPNVKGKGAWKFKGVLISDDDRQIPDFKYSLKTHPLIEDESSINEWYVVKNLTKVDYEEIVPYETVRHLENTVLSSTLGIEIRTAMELIRREGKNINAHFDLTERSNRNIYRQMMNVTEFKNIPKHIRGLAIKPQK